LAEYIFSYSPYHYVKNNPILYIDLFGLTDTIGTVINPIPIPEVVVTIKKPRKKKQRKTSIGGIVIRGMGHGWESLATPTTGSV